MTKETSFLLILAFDFIAIMMLLLYGKIGFTRRVDTFKQIVRNSLSKGYLNDDALIRYAEDQRLKYEQVMPALSRLIIELEQDEKFIDEAKLNILRQVTLLYQKTGFLSHLPDTIRFKMHDVAKLNAQATELVFQLAQEIHRLNLADRYWKRIGIVSSLIASSLTLWGYFI